MAVPSQYGPSTWYLRTFGDPALLRGTVPVPLRTKDLALLVFLGTAAGPVQHGRSRLATLLWAADSEQHALHSLSQAIARLRAVLGEDAVELTRRSVALRAVIPCDAVLLDMLAQAEPPSLDSVSLYTGDFLAGLLLDESAADLAMWAEQRRAHYRMVALRCLSTLAAAAAARHDWPSALDFGLRCAEIEPLYEEGHRCVISAWLAMGECALAVRHYEALERSMQADANLRPSAATRALVAELVPSAPRAGVARGTELGERALIGREPSVQAPAAP